MFSSARLIREAAIWLAAIALPLHGLLPGGADCGCGGSHGTATGTATRPCCCQTAVQNRLPPSCCGDDTAAEPAGTQWSKSCRCAGHGQTASPGRVLLKPPNLPIDQAIEIGAEFVDAVNIAAAFRAAQRLQSLFLTAAERCSFQCTFQC
mgnify:CR=1